MAESIFRHAIDEGLTEVNPLRAIKQKPIDKQRNTLDLQGHQERATGAGR